MQKKIKIETFELSYELSCLKQIEELQKNNIGEINNIWKAEEIEKFLSKNNSLGILARLQDKIIGFSLFLNTGNALDIFIIFVAPKYRRAGIGKKFLKKAISYCTKKLIKKILLEVNKNNKSAFMFYKNLGFKKIGLREKYYSINGNFFDAYLMQLLL